MPDVAYAKYETVFNQEGEEIGNLFRLLWGEGDTQVWMAKRAGNGSSFVTDHQPDAFRWLTNPPVATLSTEPEQPEPVATPQPTASRRKYVNR